MIQEDSAVENNNLKDGSQLTTKQWVNSTIFIDLSHIQIRSGLK